MSKQNKSLEAEPTMDDILASIKSIISEDVKKTQKKSSPQAINVNKNSLETDILDLTEMVNDDGSIVSVHEQETMSPPPRVSRPEVLRSASPASPPTPSTLSASIIRSQETHSSPEESTLISDRAFTESMKALKSLDAAYENAPKETSNFNSGKSIETLIIDLLQPMLRQWIDTNLASLVKVIVTEQVEKVMKAHLDKGKDKTVP